jgi:hypothetical protein
MLHRRVAFMVRGYGAGWVSSRPRAHGMQEARGSNPLSSTSHNASSTHLRVPVSAAWVCSQSRARRWISAGQSLGADGQGHHRSGWDGLARRRLLADDAIDPTGAADLSQDDPDAEPGLG